MIKQDQKNAGGGDRLPPHSIEAEQGVLGSILAPGGAEILPQVFELFKDGSRVFYDLRHKHIYEALAGLWEDTKPIDMILLVEALKEKGELHSVGGLAYVASLPEKVPGVSNWGHYAEIVVQKYADRTAIQLALDRGRAAFEQGMSPELLQDWRAELDVLERIQIGRKLTRPDHLTSPGEMEGQVLEHFLRGGKADGDDGPGLKLPIPIRHNIRMRESTLVSGDDGAGKTTFLNYVILHLLQQLPPDTKAVLASFEMPADVTTWVMASQLLGSKHQPDDSFGHARIKAAVEWLRRRVLIYDFLGIGDFRDVLNAFRWVAQNSAGLLFLIDSVMRIGIAEDDWKTQGFAAASFLTFAQEVNGHLFYVVHENKGESRGKDKISGSIRWRQNACNIWRLLRNHDKHKEIAKIEDRIKNEQGQKLPNESALKEMKTHLEEERRGWDTGFMLEKQRLTGTQQNGSRYVWYDENSFQFRTRLDDKPVNWLDKWNKKGNE